MDDLGKGTLLANLEGCARAQLMSLHHASHYRFLEFIRGDSLARVVKRDAR